MDDRTLKRFCASEDGRYAMSRPFYQDGFRYATDGRVAIRVPVAGVKDDSGDPPPPPMDGLPWAKRTGERLPWPTAAYVFERRWEECDCGEDYLTWDTSHVAQRVGNRLVGCIFHYLISTLPGVRFCADGEPFQAMYFRFDGGEGLIMPLRASLVLEEPEKVCGGEPQPA